MRLVLYLGGGASQSMAWLLSVPGASRTVLDIRVPYNRASLADLLGHAPAVYASAETARDMAVAAYRNAVKYSSMGTDIVGIGCTCALATDREKRGEHKAFITTYTGVKERSFSLQLAKGVRSRFAEDTLVSKLLIKAVAESMGISAQLIEVELIEGGGNADKLTVESKGTDGDAVLRELLNGRVDTVEFSGGNVYVDAPRPGRIYLPGSFNPLHDGHRDMLEAACKLHPSMEAAFELSIGNADKGLLPLEEIKRRVSQFVNAGLPLVVTQAPLFTQKADLFHNSIFVVGYDTAVRLVKAEYYGSDQAMLLQFAKLRHQGCSFLVAGRQNAEGKFCTLADMPMPDFLPRGGLFEEIPASDFRADVSSTELRAAGTWMASFAAAASKARSAALRRLQRAGSRAAAGSRGHEAALARQAAGGGEVEAGPGTDVVPREGAASSVEVASVVDHPALIITRPVEWGTVLLGFEQANKYTVYDQHGNLVALLAEDEGSIGKAIGRQLLRTRRNFTATVFSPDGQVIFTMRRPFYLINSSIYIEDGGGNIVGEVHQRWHLWKRNYDLYIDKRQFAAVQGGLLAWDFELKDEEGGTLALIDRNFSGFGKELFTDAGKYVIHFGNSPTEAAEQAAATVAAAHPDRPAPPVTALARARTDVSVIPTSTGNQLVVHRPLQLDERMVALAAAISIDYDFFSRHSYGGGFMSPFMPVPIVPYPVPAGEAAEGAAAGAEGAAEGGEGVAAAGGGYGSSGAGAGSGAGNGGAAGGAAGEAPLERDLGGDGAEAGGWFGGFGKGSEQNDEDRGWGSDGDGGGDGGDGDGGGGIFDLFRDFPFYYSSAVALYAAKGATGTSPFLPDTRPDAPVQASGWQGLFTGGGLVEGAKLCFVQGYYALPFVLQDFAGEKINIDISPTLEEAAAKTRGGKCAVLAYDAVNAHLVAAMGLEMLDAAQAYLSPYGIAMHLHDANTEFEARVVWALNETLRSVVDALSTFGPPEAMGAGKVPSDYKFALFRPGTGSRLRTAGP
ncbi:Altered inheritance rate of mitochondria 25 [Micractinium conductrix]|uniref:Altered inheritance rate of mitochondria 25 n=1 Tax=Micractinium conductrix TaxID=554055 RepID=A0A2P6V5X4_9CHLO|nr:Altered inheritance rate of mitochondria 25 [Micractinium conductrix]|eukprot:PSC69495.1 Altered inheritance rate of mitochondria 25 [Micractinium conductrix]